jgi:hypothetical protein
MLAEEERSRLEEEEALRNDPLDRLKVIFYQNINIQQLIQEQNGNLKLYLALLLVFLIT